MDAIREVRYYRSVSIPGVGYIWRTSYMDVCGGVH